MSQSTQLWGMILVFFLTHQTEEIFYSIGEWQTAHPQPHWTRFLSRSPMVKLHTRFQRTMLVIIQCLALLAVAGLTHSSLITTQIVITVFLIVMTFAFLMHITLSIATHSSMPGLSTSIFPGLPAILFLLYYTWHL